MNVPSTEPVIDGVTGFLYYDRAGRPMVSLHWQHYFQHILAKYNKTYKEELPKITPHICRHTYCTHLAKSGVSVKTVQYLMGHADVYTTLSVYTHIGLQDAIEELNKLQK